MAIIDPLYKKGPQENTKKFRPVSKTCEFGKMVEVLWKNNYETL